MFNETQKFRNQFYKFDIESSPEVFELYDKIYQDSVIKDNFLFKFRILDSDFQLHHILHVLLVVYVCLR